MRVKYFVNYGPDFSHRTYSTKIFSRLNEARKFAERLSRPFEIIRYEDNGHPLSCNGQTRTICSTYQGGV